MKTTENIWKITRTTRSEGETVDLESGIAAKQLIPRRVMQQKVRALFNERQTVKSGRRRAEALVTELNADHFRSFYCR
ncbi:hypothetical protein Y032_0329g2671 [Ancylostoma ceylanicum]|uniref:Uncharacterized protein n=1 Tax=Ancylostoma ceylanicum TaxID=53326 RepID=A0A016RZH7_9BILA|nr:hypothetical protein Y032_0329g2671 [Ancylostoma ceylanicum]